jgi:hypothetical protein
MLSRDIARISSRTSGAMGGRPRLRQRNCPEQPLTPVKPESLAWCLVHHGQLLAKRQEFEVKEGAASEQSEEGGQDGKGDSSHAGTVR